MNIYDKISLKPCYLAANHVNTNEWNTKACSNQLLCPTSESDEKSTKDNNEDRADIYQIF